jgi:hypothetical protein
MDCILSSFLIEQLEYFMRSSLLEPFKKILESGKASGSNWIVARKMMAARARGVTAH